MERWAWSVVVIPRSEATRDLLVAGRKSRSLASLGMTVTLYALRSTLYALCSAPGAERSTLDALDVGSSNGDSAEMAGPLSTLP